MDATPELTGPDLKTGIAAADVRDDKPLLGHVDGQPVVVVRSGGQVHAVAATCTHYGGPLAEGLVADGTIRCPWHHACFELATGHAHGPALAAIACYDVALEGGRLRVGGTRTVATPNAGGPRSVVLIGGGPASIACVEELRVAGHRGRITLVTSEGSDPVDRPNLSKDYLAGNAPEEWVYLRTADALAQNDVELVADAATAIDREARVVRTASGRTFGWDALLLATGAEPVRLPIEGADLPHVHVLRTLADSRAIAAASSPPGTLDSGVVIIGGGFIGLEVAASLRARGVDVTVVARETVLLERVVGAEVGAFVQRVHEGKGVAFRLGRSPAKITPTSVVLDDGSELPAKLVVMGVGVKPRVELAAAAGLAVDRGITVDEHLRAEPGIWAAGDVARYPWGGERVRIEHWQVATRHGQAVARAMLGRPPRRDVPFFWSQHHDVTLGYVGHAERFDRAELHGSLGARDAHVVYRDAGKIRAVVTLGRDQLALAAELAFEHDDAAALEAAVR
ncbi:MAG TPA: FAD-dependent oxidoreductase [Kofleriaceae bacterium]|jgi:NADPH-dependent 2,4-dienoyl-CoA reductase/sulfur reductase-like enzyme/nitrite reductase/ring-hydroxylating ferredoxin subunit